MAQNLELLDDLPPVLRTLLADAPFDFDVSQIYEIYAKLLRAGWERQAIVDLLLRNGRAMFAVERRIRARISYGPEHPEAAGVTDEELKELNVYQIAVANDEWRQLWTTRSLPRAPSSSNRLRSAT